MLAIIQDVETTGLFVSFHRVIEIAAVVIDENYGELESFSSLANPGPEAVHQADPEALEINGIDWHMIDDAPPAAEVADKFKQFLAKYWGALYYAYNVEFEQKMLGLAPWSIDPKSWGPCLMKSAMKEMEKANALKRRPSGDWKYPKLEEAEIFYGLSSDVKHRGLPDARRAAKIYQKLNEKKTRIMFAKQAFDEASHVIDQGY